MSSEALKESMARRVEDQCAHIAAEAESEANAIRDRARAQAQAVRESTIASVEREIAQLRERWEQKARAEAARAELAMKNEAVEAVMDTVTQRIRAIVDSDRFTTILSGLLAELMSAAEGDIVVLAPPSHVDFVKSQLSEHGHGSVPVEGSAALWDGVALQDPRRTYRISNTLTSRYSQVLQEARKICMKELFEG